MFHCNVCEKEFTKKVNLYRHVREQHEGLKYECTICQRSFARKQRLLRHMKIHVNDPDQNEKSDQSVEKENESQHSDEGLDCNVEEVSVLEDAVIASRHTPKTTQTDPELFITGIKSSLVKYLEKHLRNKRGIKWNIFINACYVRELSNGEHVEAFPYFRSKNQISLTPEEIPDQIEGCLKQIIKAAEEFEDRGSGWVMDHIEYVQVDIVTYMPLVGGSFIELPTSIKNCLGVINIKSNDDKCFIWSIIAKLHPAKSNRGRVEQYKQYESELNCTDISFPFILNTLNLKKFETKNKLSINVYGFENEVFPLHISQQTKVSEERQIDLLYLVSGEKKHFCLIRDLSRLLCNFTKHNGKSYVCRFCLHRYSGACAEENHRKHVKNCSLYDPQRIKMPKDEDKILKFSKYDWMQKVPYVIYSDFECIINKMSTCLPDSSLSNTTKLSEHVACGFSYVIVGPDGTPNAPVTYRGIDAIDVFLDSLLMEEETISELLRMNVPMDLTPAELDKYHAQTHCYVCSEIFSLKDPPVKDHCHYTGRFRGAAHNSCNLKLRVGKFIPVILHNLSRYDAHLIMQRIGLKKEEEITTIPSNTETYISFSYGRLRFIDSFRFMPASLETLISNLAKGGAEQFPILNSFYHPQQVTYLLKKLTYPYDYMSNIEKFDETNLPPKEAFFNALTDENVSDEGYENLQKVWSVFEIENLGELHDLYVQVDTLQLADVFENFRKMCFDYYQLDCAHAFTGPGLAWEAALHMTKVRLELLQDVDQHIFIENGIRGGVSMISHRFAQANNPYLSESYDPEQPSKYIMYLDMNNLYGYAMVDYLPTSNFSWVPVKDLMMYATNVVLPLPDDSPYGFILEVDLEYPDSIHQQHNCFPLAPESRKITTDMFSNYYKLMLKDLNLPVKETLPKLVPNLNSKKRYVLHYRNLKYYVSKGLKLTKVHKILSFNQEPWLRPFINFNTEKRKQAKNDFERDFFKLLNNSTFGKTMENLRNRIDFHLVQTPERAIKKASSPAFEKFTIFHNELVGIEMKKKSLTLCRPIYTGFTILDISKLFMYQFHYDYIKKTYDDRAQLLFTDTDSLTYVIQTEDVYADFKKDSNLFDFSGYPINHPLFSNVNKKVIGKMKDELDGTPIREFCGLRPKMYSILSNKGEKKTAKGICKRVVKNKIRHQNYCDSLFKTTVTSNTMKRIVSLRHELFTISQNKIALNPCDNKRYILGDGVSTLAYGHKWIKILK